MKIIFNINHIDKEIMTNMYTRLWRRELYLILYENNYFEKLFDKLSNELLTNNEKCFNTIFVETIDIFIHDINTLSFSNKLHKKIEFEKIDKYNYDDLNTH